MARKKDGGRQRSDYHSTDHRHQTKPALQSKYLYSDGSFPSFAAQLANVGLQLREIPGDGNCLFRALGDQLEGHTHNHQHHRRAVVDYMRKHRKDFEPFVEDEVPFNRYTRNLQMLGTFAGNDCIVAFARLHKVNVVIHQLNSPLWTIEGTSEPNPVELHISFHNGEHYSSVRRMGDYSQSPANVNLKDNGVRYPKTNNQNNQNNQNANSQPNPSFGSVAPLHQSAATMSGGNQVQGHQKALNSDEQVLDLSDGYESDYDNLPSSYSNHNSIPPPSYAELNSTPDGTARIMRDTDAIVEQVMHDTGNTDRVFVEQTLSECFYDVTVAIDLIISLTADSNALNRTSEVESNGLNVEPSETANDESSATSGTKPKVKLSASEMKKLKKAEKKRLKTERDREKFLAKSQKTSPPTVVHQMTSKLGNLRV